MRKNHTPSTKGFVLPVTVGIIVILVLLGTGLLALGFTSRVQAIRHSEDIYARAAADSGVTHALFLMNKKLDEELVWDNSTLNLIFASNEHLDNSNEYYSFKVTGDPSGFLITSTGISGHASRTIYGNTRIKSIFDYGIVVKTDLVMSPNSSIDSYNSTTGETGLPMLIGTNSTDENSIIVQPGAVINANVHVGVGSDPASVVSNSGDINGEVEPMPHEYEFPPIVIPPLTEIDTKIEAKNVTYTLNSGDSGRYNSIDVSQANGVLEINGDVVLYVTEDISLGNGSEIKITVGSSLIVYLDGDFMGDNGSGVTNETATPANFKLYGTGGEGQIIDLKAKDEFYGAVYAPDAELSLKAGANIYGAFIGESFEIKSETSFYYDITLKNSLIDDVGTRLIIRNWREI